MSQPINPSHRRFRGRDFTELALETIRAWISEKTLCREHIARRVCQEFGWINAQGKLKTMSCKVALLRMHRAGLIALPVPKRPAPQRRKKTAAGMLLPLPQSLITLSAEQLRHVRLDVVQTQADRAIYHQLLQAHHYLGAGSMAGAQLRYLARGGGEVVGALGFGARPARPAPQKHSRLSPPKKLPLHPQRMNSHGVHRIFALSGIQRFFILDESCEESIGSLILA